MSLAAESQGKELQSARTEIARLAAENFILTRESRQWKIAAESQVRIVAAAQAEIDRIRRLAHAECYRLRNEISELGIKLKNIEQSYE